MRAASDDNMEKSLQKQLLFTKQTQISLAIKIAAAAAATIVLFSQDLTVVVNDAWRSETTSHILAIPFLFAYLVYRKRAILRAVISLPTQNQPRETRHLPTVAGILLSATAILLYWYGSYTFTPLEYHMFALPVFLAGLSLILFNPETLWQLAFPIAFLIFLMPPPSEILYSLGATLSVVSSEASNAIVNAVGIRSTITSEYGSPTIVITGPDGATLPFTVDIACSGIYSLIGFLIFATFVAYIIRDKPWKKLALLFAGLPLIYMLNIIRITVILLIGHQYGGQLALQVFHLLGGWLLMFLGTLLLLTISGKILKTQIFTIPTEKCSQCNPKPQSDWAFCYGCGRILKPEIVTLQKIDITKLAAITSGIILLMSIQAPVFALTQSPPIVVINTPSGQRIPTDILPQVPDYSLSFVYRDTQFEAIAKQDMSLLYIYAPVTHFKGIPIWVAIEIAPTRSSLHRWEICLITWYKEHGYQPNVDQIDLRDIQLTQNPPIISRYFVFQYKATNETQAVLYWYESATFTVNSTSQQKHVKISLIGYPESPEDLPSVESQLVIIATAIANYWQPIKTWSQITMLISQNGANLSAATSALLAAVTILHHLETRKQKRANANAYQKLSKPNMQLAYIVRETEKERIPTLNNIASTYEKRLRQPFDKEQLFEKLSELEKTGIIKRYVANKQDEPIQVWKTQVTPT